MRRYLICFIIAFFTVFSPVLYPPQLSGQEAQEPPYPGLFPLALVLDAAQGHSIWQPYWPLEFPPDAFIARPGSPNIKRILVEGEGFLLNYQYSPDGRIETYPFLMDNGNNLFSPAQISLAYRGQEIGVMIISFPPAEERAEETGDEEGEEGSNEYFWTLEFLEYQDSFPSLVRANFGDLWFFISLYRGGNEIMETWYNEEGLPLGAFGYTLIDIGGEKRIRSIRDYFSPAATSAEPYFPGTLYHYNSLGLISAAQLPGGHFRVYYHRNGLPRFWDYSSLDQEAAGAGAARYYLQWEGNTLVRIRGEGAEEDLDYRYEYSLDERGNWIERRETRMLPALGLVFPSPGTLYRRTLEYQEDE